MERIPPRTGEKLHYRNIMMDTWEAGERHMVVEGRLVEERCRDYRHLSGQVTRKGELHHMVVRMLIEIPGLVIAAVETELVTIPRDDCSAVRDSLDALVGLRITSGFTKRVRELLGGVKGCTHLTHLVLTMAPAALQGYWALRAARSHGDGISTDERQRLKMMEKILEDTCYAWRNDGPAMVNLRKRIGDMDNPAAGSGSD